eukprot:2500836-Pleurochrysis_carterae.AAC.1
MWAAPVLLLFCHTPRAHRAHRAHSPVLVSCCPPPAVTRAKGASCSSWPGRARPSQRGGCPARREQHGLVQTRV